MVQLLKDKLYLDCEHQRRNGTCKASLSNSPNRCWNKKTNKAAVSNCELVVSHLRNEWKVNLKATKFIPSNTEILCPYSKSHHMSMYAIQNNDQDNYNENDDDNTIDNTM